MRRRELRCKRARLRLRRAQSPSHLVPLGAELSHARLRRLGTLLGSREGLPQAHRHLVRPVGILMGLRQPRLQCAHLGGGSLRLFPRSARLRRQLVKLGGRGERVAAQRNVVCRARFGSQSPVLLAVPAKHVVSRRLRHLPRRRLRAHLHRFQLAQHHA